MRRCQPGSRRQAEEAIKQLEQLRNNLAHAQDIVACDWATIGRLCEFIGKQMPQPVAPESE